MSLLDCLPHRVRRVQQFHEQDEDDVGDRVVDETSIFDEPVACWIQNMSRATLVEWDKRTENIVNHVFFKQDVGLGEDDRLEVLGHPHLIGSRFKVLEYADRSAGLGRVYSAICEIER